MKNLISALKNGEALVGTVIVSGSPANIEISGYLGYDFVFIDTEHAPNTPYGIETENLIRAAYAANITPLLRIAGNDIVMAKKVLDFGAKGVIAPFINTRADAEKLASSCLFPPLGNRGGAPVVRATKYGAMSWSQYVKQANEETLIVPIIERKQSVENLDEICSVKGVNGILCGPFDLAVELGILPKGELAVSETLQMLTDPIVVEYVDKMIDAGRRHGKYVANIAWSAQNAVDNVARGCQIVALTGDNNMFIEIAKKYLDETKAGIRKVQRK
jgi:4-hydroxy-2-oxoheptanedioate aldolase